jgi:hypothetical protein
VSLYLLVMHVCEWCLEGNGWRRWCQFVSSICWTELLLWADF